MIPSAAETTLLRTQPHATKLWLSIYQPATALACQVDDAAIAKGAQTITYDTVSSGNYLAVEAGMTLLVGTAAGLDDKGRIRVKSITDTIITVAENSDIAWADDDYLTVIDFFELNAVYPRITQSGDPPDVTFYKDYDIVYTDQNSVLGSLIVMGGHYAGFLENGSCQVYYSASGTYNVNEEALTYSWTFEGASVTGSTAGTPGYITYTNPGHYTTRLAVSNVSGGTDVSYRHISIYDRPENGTNVPILSWGFEGLNGSRDQGGYTTTIRIHQDISSLNIRDGSLVVIFADDYYGSTKQSIGGSFLNRDSIVFVGYVIDGTIQYDYKDSIVTFDVGSPTEIMKIAEGFSISVESKTTPATWFELQNMNTRKALYHYLRWHTTAIACTDINVEKMDNLNIQYFDTDRSSIYDALQTFVSSTILGEVVSDRQGLVWIEPAVWQTRLQHTFDTNLSILKQDWVNEPEIEQSSTPRVSFIEIGGIQYDGPATNEFAAYLAAAPGNAPKYRGKVDRIQGLALLSQAHLNQLGGDLLAHRNAEFARVSYLLSGNYRNFDIAPQEKVPLFMEAADNHYGVTFSGKEFYVRELALVYDAQNESARIVVNLYEITSGDVGEAIIIPDVPPIVDISSGTGGNYDVTPIVVPPISAPPSAGAPDVTGGTIQGVFRHRDAANSGDHDGDDFWILNADAINDINSEGFDMSGESYLTVSNNNYYLILALGEGLVTNGVGMSITLFQYNSTNPAASAVISENAENRNDHASTFQQLAVTAFLLVDTRKGEYIRFRLSGVLASGTITATLINLGDADAIDLG